MAAAIMERLGAALCTLWSGWTGLAAVCLLAALWQAGHEAYGPFILTAPLQTVTAIGALAQDPEAWRIGGLTLQRALTGFALAAAAGTVAGLVAGYCPAFLRLVQPLVTVLLGVPPIAWIVLAMIWFGGTDATVRVCRSRSPARPRASPPATAAWTTWHVRLVQVRCAAFWMSGCRKRRRACFPHSASPSGWRSRSS